MLDPTGLLVNLRLHLWVERLCCLMHIAHLYMAVHSGVRCSSTPIVNWMFHAFRHLLHEPRWCSASQLFVANNVSSFAANIRKFLHSLWRSLNASDNVLVLPAKAREYVWPSLVCVSVYLSVTTITKKIVDGFVPNFTGRFRYDR